MAKVQLNNSWELSAVPYLPVMDLVAEHCHNLATAGVDGMMLSWSLGGYPVAEPGDRRPLPPPADAGGRRGARAVGPRRFGPRGAPRPPGVDRLEPGLQRVSRITAACSTMPGADGPGESALPRSTGYRATMAGIPYDDLAAWRGPYPAEIFAAQFEKVAAGWQRGLTELQAAVAQTPASLRPEVEAELRLRRPPGCIFRAWRTRHGSSCCATPWPSGCQGARILILALPKSGTTICYQILRESLPDDSLCLFEPSTCSVDEPQGDCANLGNLLRLGECDSNRLLTNSEG